jgi:phosphate transport system substrate-binding protein
MSLRRRPSCPLRPASDRFGRRGFVLSLLTAGCAGRCGEEEGARVALNGAGATFPFPLYSKWIAEYRRVTPDVRVNYQSIGSGGGVRQMMARTVDFGASDVPLQPDEERRAPAPLLHVPTALGAVVVSYHLPGIDAVIRVTPELLARIYLGEVTAWNAPELRELNPNVALPAGRITVVHRSDGSGTTAIFTELLASASSTFKERVGSGKSVRFPTGLGAKGNEGVAGQIKTTPGTIGYVELAYAMQTRTPLAQIQNADGQFVTPSLEGISAAAAGGADRMPDDYRISITNAPGAAAYPIAAFTYILVSEDMKDATKAEALVQFLWWAVHDGQDMGPDLHYAKLPPALVTKIEATLKTLRGGGEVLLAEK